jgi:hypothetical protein
VSNSVPEEVAEGPGGSSGAWSERRFELIATILLALAALSTTWAGFQASLWDGIQSSEYTQASALRTRGSASHLEANQLRLADLSVIENFIDASIDGDEMLADFYRERMSPQLEPAFEAWIALDPFTNPEAPLSPLTMPEYRLEADQEAAELIATAETTFRAGEDANTYSDRYTLATLIFASVLFFTAISERFEVPLFRAVLLVIAAVGFVGGVVVIATQPITGG